MFTVVLRPFRRLCLFGLLAALAAPVQAQETAPQVVTIGGTPLTVRVGADDSFQILNSEVPGVGQMYPSTDAANETGDMGFFVRVGDDLYGPDFENHPADTATGFSSQIPELRYSAFTPVSISPVAGAGTPADPFRVTVVNDIGGTGLRATMQVSYVNGRNYLGKALTVQNSRGTAQSVRIFLGGDIYLANDDNGIPHLEAGSSSPGGRNCPEEEESTLLGKRLAGARADASGYFVLFIPQTPATAYSARYFSEVWDEIASGQLDNAVESSECTDNGAALQWNRDVPANSNVSVVAATSFGDVPDIAQFNLTQVQPDHGTAGQSVDVTVTGIGFDPFDTDFDFGAGITIGNLVFVGTTTATMTLTIAADATPGPRDLEGRQSDEGPSATLPGAFTVLASEEPQPGTLQFSAASYGTSERYGTATVTVTRSGGGSGGASVHYATIDDSAHAGTDYTATSGTLQWADGDSAAKTITVPITNDDIIEGSRSFTLALTAASGAALGVQSTTTVTIVDDDSQHLPGEESPGSAKGGGSGAFGLAGSLLLGLLAALRGRRLRRRACHGSGRR
ncbi:MAG: Calx-beta domain-containing protein [Solimonas sp.]